jgi:hypothetical protein
VPDILHRLVIRASPARVYHALTTPDGLAAWWTRDVMAEPAVGSVALFGFNRREVTFRMLVQELVEATRVRWHCLGGHPEWKTPRSRSPFPGLPTGWCSTSPIAAGNRAKVSLFCNFDWARYLASLKSYLETGAGAPHAG